MIDIRVIKHVVFFTIITILLYFRKRIMNQILINIFSRITYKLPSVLFPRLLNFMRFFYFSKSFSGNNILSFNTHDQSGGASKIAFQLAEFNRKFFSSYFYCSKKQKKHSVS